MNTKLSITGLSCAIGGYVIWGITPLFWKLLDSIPSLELLGYRIFWSLPFLLLILVALGRFNSFLKEFKRFTLYDWGYFSLATLLLLVNWFTFIWAVNNGFIIYTSLGYYMNPVMSILLGVILLREKMSGGQWVAFALVCLGLFVLMSQVNTFPWISFTLAFSFGFYGFMKKKTKQNPLISLTMEMFLASIVSVFYFYFIFSNGVNSFPSSSMLINILLVCTGIVTAFPLLLFNFGTHKLPLYLMGFLQYIAPTLSLCIGIFVYHETFSSIHFLSFCIIWIGLIVLSVSTTKATKRMYIG